MTLEPFLVLALRYLPCLLCGVAAYTDLRTERIPNWLTLPALALGVLLQTLSTGTSGLLSSVAGVLLCGLVPFILFLKGQFGGGDVKLLAALGAYFGPRMGLEVQLIAMVLAALFGMVALAWQGKLLATLRSVLVLSVRWALPRSWRARWQATPTATIRFGAPAFVAALLVEATALWSGL